MLGNDNYINDSCGNCENYAPTDDLTKNQAYDKGFITAMKLYSRSQGDLISRESARMCLTGVIEDDMTISDFICRTDKRLREIPACKEPQGEWKNPTVLTIPDNPTNGNMIKVMFPDAKISFSEGLGEKGTVFMIFNNPETILIFDMDWWNAPWKENKE